MTATQYRSATEIAKDIRRDIKQAIKLHELPADLKVSVRSRYFAGGQSIDVTWSAGTVTHELVCTHHRTPYQHCLGSSDDHLQHALHLDLSAHGRTVERKLNLIMSRYNWDRSDVMTDYFDVLFYGRAEWDWQAKLTPSSLVGIDRRVAETFLTLHQSDRMPAWEALQVAEKLEAGQ